MAVNTTTVEVTMPQMGDSVSEGTILEWHKQEGDEVSEDETLVEISTDKVDAEVPAPTTGTVTKIHAAEGDTITVGAVLAEIAPGDNGARPAQPDAEPAAEPEGQVVEIATDKVDAEVPAPASGTMGEILASAGDTVSVGQVLAKMTTGDGAGPKAPEPTSAPRPQGAPAAAPARVPEGVKVTPVARRVAAAEGIDLQRVQGSGPAGRISKAAVLAASSNGAVPQPLKGASAMLARYMDESRAVPTATSFRTVTVTVLDGRRRQLKEGGQRVSFTHLIAYAIARAATEQMPV